MRRIFGAPKKKEAPPTLEQAGEQQISLDTALPCTCCLLPESRSGLPRTLQGPCSAVHTIFKCSGGGQPLLPDKSQRCHLLPLCDPCNFHVHFHAGDRLTGRGDRIDEQINKLDAQLVKFREQIKKTRPGPSQEALKRRALTVSSRLLMASEPPTAVVEKA